MSLYQVEGRDNVGGVCAWTKNERPEHVGEVIVPTPNFLKRNKGKQIEVTGHARTIYI